MREYRTQGGSERRLPPVGGGNSKGGRAGRLKITMRSEGCSNHETKRAGEEGAGQEALG